MAKESIRATMPTSKSAGPMRVFAHLTKRLKRVAAAAPGSEYPNRIKQGQTDHFTVFYDPDSLGDAGAALADGVLKNCEADYATLSGFFGAAAAPPSLNVIIAGGIGGAYHYGCSATDLFCDGVVSPSPDLDHTRMLVIAELVEVFEALQGLGWDCGASNGEGLSRVLATDLYPDALDGFTTAAVWLDTPDRPDFVNNTDPTDTNFVSTGCAVLFLNWLRYQLTFQWSDIVASGAQTLGQTYTNLTGQADGFEQFSTLLQNSYPIGTPSGLTTDNPFPLPASVALRGGVAARARASSIRLDEVAEAVLGAVIRAVDARNAAGARLAHGPLVFGIVWAPTELPAAVRAAAQAKPNGGRLVRGT